MRWTKSLVSKKEGKVPHRLRPLRLHRGFGGGGRGQKPTHPTKHVKSKSTLTTSDFKVNRVTFTKTPLRKGGEGSRRRFLTTMGDWWTDGRGKGGINEGEMRLGAHRPARLVLLVAACCMSLPGVGSDWLGGAGTGILGALSGEPPAGTASSLAGATDRRSLRGGGGNGAGGGGGSVKGHSPEREASEAQGSGCLGVSCHVQTLVMVEYWAIVPANPSSPLARACQS